MTKTKTTPPPKKAAKKTPKKKAVETKKRGRQKKDGLSSALLNPALVVNSPTTTTDFVVDSPTTTTFLSRKSPKKAGEGVEVIAEEAADLGAFYPATPKLKQETQDEAVQENVISYEKPVPWYMRWWQAVVFFFS